MKRDFLRFKPLLIFSFILVNFLTSNKVFGQLTVGPNNAGAGTNVTGIGTVAWTNPGNITIPGSNSQAPLNNNTSNYLQGTNYGFSIPHNATILGIVVVIGKLRESGAGNLMYDNAVYLVKDGITTGSNYADPNPWTRDRGTPADVIYGGATDLWGTTWTPADINSTNFGVAISAVNPLAVPIYARVDYMQITVYYSIPGLYTTAGASTFTVPTGVSCLMVEAWGGGGKGGTRTSNGAAAGGGGGAYSRSELTVTPGNTYNLYVGEGSTTTASGGNTWFDATSTFLASGGNSVANNNNTSATGGSAASGVGSIKYNGGNGAIGTNNNFGGGGGSSAGTGSYGNYTNTSTNSLTGGSIAGGGNGGDGRSGGQGNGNIGLNPGGGGGGALRTSNGTRNGGNGADGMLIITWLDASNFNTIASSPICTGNTSTVTITSSSLLNGNYTVTYNLSAPNAATGLTSAMSFSGGTGTFSTSSLVESGSTTITITNIKFVDWTCSTNLSSGNTSSIITTAPSQPSTITGTTTPCIGSTQTYSVTNVGGVTYNWTLPVGWSGSSSTNSINVTVGSSSGNITVTPSNGCIGPSRSISVTVNPTPTIIGTSPGAICGTGSVTISATASSGTINWYAASTGGSSLGTGTTFITPSISSSTTYYVDATNGTCTSTPRVAVVASIIPPASITANGGGTYCTGDNVTLTSTATNITNQYWTGPNSFYSLSQNPTISAISSANSGTYSVTGSALSGINLVANSDFESGNVGFGSTYTNSSNLFPEGTYAVVANPNSVHSGFTACSDHTTGGGTPVGLQMVINGAVTAGVNIWSQTVNVIPNTDYQYTYWVQSVVASNPSQLQLYINGSPAGPTYTADLATCSWKQFTYNWNSGSSTSANLSLVNQNTIAGGNDFALDDIVFQQACAATASVDVTVNAAPTPGTIGSNQTICQGNPVATLTSTANGTGDGTISYEWQTNASGSYVTIPGATSATYSPPALSATTSYQRRTVALSGVSCYSSYTTPVTITVTSPFAIAGGPDTVCQAAVPIAITLSGSSIGGGATTGAWSIISGGGSLSSVAQIATPSTVTYTPAANYSGMVTLRLTTNLSGGCSAIDDRTINVTPIPTSDAGTNISTCSNSGSVNITAGSSATNYSNVTWTSNGTGSFTNANSLTTATYTPSAADIAAGSLTLTLTATGNSPCGNAVSTKTLTITPLPTATISYSGSPFCRSLSTGQAVTLTGTSGGTYSASPAGLTINSGTGAITPSTSTSGTYTVTYTIAASGGCSVVTATTSVTVYSDLTASISGGTSPVCYNTSPGTFTATGSGGTGSYTYLWYRDGISTGVTTQTYNPGNLTASASFYCDITSGSCGTANSPVTSISMETVAPVITCPGNVTQNVDPGYCSALVAIPAPTAVSDNCGGTPSLSWAGGAGVTVVDATHATVAVGTSTIIYTATDDAGNTSTCNFTVTVVDNVDPVITCPADVSVNGFANIPAQMTRADFGTGISDNCSVDDNSLVVTDVYSSNCYAGQPLVITRTYTISDSNGRSASCSQTITVNNVSILIDSADLTACSSGSATLTSAVSGFSPANYQWETSTDGGLIWNPVSGETGTELVVATPVIGHKYRLKVSTGTVNQECYSNVLTLVADTSIPQFPVTASKYSGGVVLCDKSGPTSVPTLITALDAIDNCTDLAGLRTTYTITLPDNSTVAGTDANVSVLNAYLFPIGTSTVLMDIADESGNRSGVLTFEVKIGAVISLGSITPDANGLTPDQGSAHTYSVAAENGYTFTWTVNQESPAGSGLYPNDITGSLSITGQGTESAAITWGTASMPGNYRVSVTKTNNSTNCQVSQVLDVTVLNVFNPKVQNFGDACHELSGSTMIDWVVYTDANSVIAPGWSFTWNIYTVVGAVETPVTSGTETVSTPASKTISYLVAVGDGSEKNYRFRISGVTDSLGNPETLTSDDTDDVKIFTKPSIGF